MTKVQSTPAHPYADIFPLNEGPPLWELAERIKIHGLREEIVLYEGKILDGRRRELGCFRVGVEPRYREFGSRPSDGDDPLEFVIDHNLHRRHLGDGDRKLAAARYAQAKAGKPQSKDNNHLSLPVDNRTESRRAGDITVPDAKTPTLAETAEKFDVSEREISRAKTVLANGTSSLLEAVKDDVVSVTDAAKVAKEPPKVQNAAVKKVRQGKAKTLTEAIGNDEKVVVDCLKKKVHASLNDIFSQISIFRSLMARIASIRSEANDLSNHAAGGWIDHQDLDRCLGQAHNHLRFAMPYCECPKCRRKPQKSCKACKGTGWINETMFGSSATESDKIWLEDRP